jgi:hypothetical protein
MQRPLSVLILIGAALGGLRVAGVSPADAPLSPAVRAERFERAVAAADRVMRAWLAKADPETGLLPDRLFGPGDGRRDGNRTREYTPHNSGADLYPYLILTAQITQPDLLDGVLLEMLRSDVRYTTSTAGALPGSFDFDTRRTGEPRLFGAGEYAKDGLITVTEYLGRTPWFTRMVDMVADAMERAPVESRFGRLPASDTELNGDYLQVLPRLALMTGDERFLEWGRRIGDAYIDEVLPGSHGVPASQWNFTTHTGDGTLRLRDHGNELVVGLVLQFAIEHARQTPRAARWQPVIARMLDRILESANPDGMLYNVVDAATLAPKGTGLSDNWGYIYGAVYTFYMTTGETKYRDAVRHVLGSLSRYRRHVWEPRALPELPLGSFDGYADAIESAVYLVNREPVPAAIEWIESEMEVLLGMQRPDGHFEYWYGEGNFNRTALLYALMQSGGVRPAHWRPGVGVGASHNAEGLRLHLKADGAVHLQFDRARHRRVMNLPRNIVRLNEFPEWFVVDENMLYEVTRPGGGDSTIRLGAELVSGITLAPGDWLVRSATGAR